MDIKQIIYDLTWCEALSVTLELDVPPLSPEDNSTPHFKSIFYIYILNKLKKALVQI